MDESFLIEMIMPIMIKINIRSFRFSTFETKTKQSEPVILLYDNYHAAFTSIETTPIHDTTFA